MSDFTFSRDDLLLLMKSYENTIQSNTALLEQQKRVVEDQTKILQKLVEVARGTDDIVTKQTDLINRINEIAATCDNKAATFQTSLSENRVESIKGHGNTKSRITFVYGGLFTIVISLVGLLISSYKYLPTILEAVNTLQTKAGILP